MKPPAIFFSLILLPFSIQLGTAEDPAVFSDDFEAKTARWEMVNPEGWSLKKLDGGNTVFENSGKTKYEPPFRSPKNIALIKDLIVGDFVFTAKVQTRQESRGHRDMCVFFGHQDASKFYYIHLGEKRDDHSCQIFIVNEAARTKISENSVEGIPWKNDHWHQIKVVRKVESGLIEIYFDDMKTPTHVAHDKTFSSGRIGIGTFDDKGWWDELRINGKVVESTQASAAATEKPDPKSLKFSKWTEAFQVPDPVAISFDEKGRAYVSQTQRRKAQDLDIRPNSDWIPQDLSFISTEDKRAYYRKQFTSENSKANEKRVKDYNGDGSHDLADLTQLSERIHLIEDTTGDGYADKTSVYAEGFTDEIAGIAAGVMHLNGDVYTTIVPDVWKLRDTDGDDKADTRESIAHGFGVHLAYAGHDMHGLTPGPDGRVYWTIGDKGLNVTSKEGNQYKYPNHGALLRCDPDGSHFEVYARGLRNIQEIAFDQFGNIFGVDNDADNAGEKERFVYIAQHIDVGWRSNWQYQKGTGYNVWMDERMSVPWNEGQPAHITPCIRNYENGPAGMTFNPGTALSPAYHNYFFHTSAPNGQQWAFQAKEDGASFQMANDHQIGNGIPLVGINFAPDGALYGVDWGGGYPLNEQGAVWKIDVPGANAEIREAVAKLIATDFQGMESKKLLKYLAHDDQRIRLKAQFEMVRTESLKAFEAIAKNNDAALLSRVHAIWGIGQLHRKAKVLGGALIPLLKSTEPEVRTQAAKIIGDSMGKNLARHKADFTNQQGTFDEQTLLVRELTLLLRDDSDRVKFHAAIALGNLGIPEAADALIAFAESIPSQEKTYLRHSAVVGLTGCASSEKLTSLKSSTSEVARTAAVIALRRRGDDAVATFLDDPNPLVATDAARAIYDDWMIPKAMPMLAKSLENPTDTEAFIRRAINANLRLGTAAAAARVADFSAKAKQGETMRIEAILALKAWEQPPVLDRVVGRYRELDSRDSAIPANALSAHLKTLLTDPSQSIQAEAMSLASQLKIDIDPEALTSLLANSNATTPLRIEALRSLVSQKADDKTLRESFDISLAAKDPVLRAEGLTLLSKVEPESFLAHAKKILSEDDSISILEKQTAIQLLGKSEAAQAKALIEPLLSNFDSQPASMHLDLAEAGSALKLSGPAPDFKHCIEGGNAERGKATFLNHVGAQCIRCHKVKDGKGSNIGPNLKSTGRKKNPEYLLEALVNPQAQIAKGYGTISLTLKNGDNVAGQYRSEEKGVIHLRDAENKITKVKVADVKVRSPIISTMPPVGFILQKQELRDVMAYLLSLKAE